jgi:hypothetical protein
MRVTSINSTFVFIGANNRIMDALSSGRIATIGSAEIIVITIDFFLIKTLIKSA